MIHTTLELPVKKGARFAAIKLASEKPELFSFRVKGYGDCGEPTGLFAEMTLDDFDGGYTPEEIEEHFNEYTTCQLWIEN